MVSFQCDGCADTVKKPKLDQHRQRCWASFTCLDCSKTFQNQEYKSHTSCISEAEKYQGALYKGPRKGQQQPPAKPAAAPSPAPAAAATPAPAAGIHPSRLNQIENPPAEFHGGRGGYGRGAGPSARGRGGAVPKGRGAMISGENKRAPEGGMRSWGTSPAVTDSEPSTPAPTPAPASAPAAAAARPTAKDKDKKKRRKGDKGGTGSKANSKHPRGESLAASEAPTAASEEPAQKKRKRSTSPAPTAEASASTTPAPTAGDAGAVSDKTLKRLRKSAAKVGEKTPSLSLDEWVKRIADAKKEQIDVGDVNKAAKVSFEDGKWVLSF